MSVTPKTQNLQRASWTLADLLKLHGDNLSMDINCHAVATVASFNSSAQTIQATINYPMTFLVQNADGTISPQTQPYPILVDVPVVVLSGGAAGMTFPIAAGDTCLILFNDRALGAWYSSGQIVPLQSNRAHSLADGIALIGIRSSQAPISSYDGVNPNFFNGENGVKVTVDGVKIYNAITTFGTVLNTFLTACSSASTVAEIASAAGTLATAITGLIA